MRGRAWPSSRRCGSRASGSPTAASRSWHRLREGRHARARARRRQGAWRHVAQYGARHGEGTGRGRGARHRVPEIGPDGRVVAFLGSTWSAAGCCGGWRVGTVAPCKKIVKSHALCQLGPDLVGEGVLPTHRLHAPDHPAIDPDDGSRDVARGVARQEGCHSGELVGPTVAARRDGSRATGGRSPRPACSAVQEVLRVELGT